MVNTDSIDKWLESRKGMKPLGRKKGRKKAKAAAVKVAKVAKTAKKVRRGRPPKAKTAKAKRGAPRKATRAAGCEIVVQGNLNLETIQDFVTQLQGGANLQIAPSKDGYILRTV